MEREEASSLAKAASRLSLPTSAGRSLPQRPPNKSCVRCTRIRKPGLPRGRCPPRSARPFALRVLAPPRCARSPQKAPLEGLSVCYPRVRHLGVRHVPCRRFASGQAKATATARGVITMRKANTSNRPSIYQTVTDRIISSLKAGVIPWEKPWNAPRFTSGPFPRNFYTGKPYRGINILLLWSSEYSSPFWLTFKQAQALKGNVRKGEHGTQI